ncbi:MAG: hypothetical protein JNJ60_06990 [Rhodocyclaceae bacterium]|nr:hypothetical protein [Rhodocyclaceae bacterium]
MAALALDGAAAAPRGDYPLAIVNLEQTALRAAPRDGAQQQAQLAAGDVVEIRGERLNYLQVYDHRRERAGFVRADRLHRTELAPAEMPALLAVLRHLRDQPGQEALGIAYAAAWLKAAAPAQLAGSDAQHAFEALGTLADRLAERATRGQAAGRPGEAAAAAQLETAAALGVEFASFQRGDRMQICYTGDAWKRLLATGASGAQRAAAALALSRAECSGDDLGVSERARLTEARASLLDGVDTDELPAYFKNRIALRRAALWSSVAFDRARAAQSTAGAAAERALAELATVVKTELPDEDLPAYNDAAMRVNAVRWAAAAPAAVPAVPAGLAVVAAPGQAPGETCVTLIDAARGASAPLTQRCTFGLVWTASAASDRKGNALALAVQPLDGWRELWIFQVRDGKWGVDVLPPAASGPELGYAEFAGWSPDGRQLLVAREARSEGKYRRSFEVLRADTLTPERQSSDPSSLGAFQRWQDAAWKRASVALR